MIVFIYGTTAEAIKLAPIIRRLKSRGIPFQQWVTMQHTDSLRAITPVLGLPEPDHIIADGNRGKPITKPIDMLGWLWDVARWGLRNARRLRAELPAHSIIVVHGDTVTTVAGAWIARRLRLPSAHVEAGLRSGSWRHPFPEELDRRIVGRWAAVHYPPQETAAANLAGRANVVLTHGNTVIDAALDHDESETTDDAEFGLVLLHRFEFISNPKLVEETVRLLAEHSPVPLRVMLDAYSEGPMVEAIAAAPAGRFVSQPKLGHAEFIATLKRARLVVTDSGGVQEEAALIGVPTLVHRRATERHEGLGANVVLSEWDPAVLVQFLADPDRYRLPLQRPERSPSDIIVDDLIARGYATP